MLRDSAETILLVVGWGGALVVVLGWWMLRRRGGRRWSVIAWGTAGALATMLAGAALWYRYRPWPGEIEREVAPGVVVRRFARATPRPMVVSVAEVDLTTPGLSVLTTSVPRGQDVPAETTSDFAARHGAVVAVNAHFFTPFWSRGLFDYYPRAGDPVRPLGLNAADGVWTPGEAFAGTSAWWDQTARMSFGQRPREPWDAITGRHRLVRDGRVVAPADSRLEPRVALASADDGTRMWLVVVDGRQPGYSEGATLREMAELALELGATDAIELDGGGSAALVVREGDDAPRPVNSPIHTRIPGRERPVATHLGIRIDG
jgi:hypothetical protein